MKYPFFICTNLAPIASGDVFLTKTKRLGEKKWISLRNREVEAAEDPLISRFGEPIRMDQIQHLFTACFLQLLRLQGKFGATTFLACTYNTCSIFCLIHKTPAAGLCVWKENSFLVPRNVIIIKEFKKWHAATYCVFTI